MGVDDENIFLNRMPGAWKLDISLSDILAPDTYKSFDVDQLILTRNDTTEYDFAVSTYKGNPVITYLVPPNYEPAFAYCMLATGENADDDILFIRDNHSGSEGMMAYKREQYADYDF